MSIRSLYSFSRPSILFNKPLSSKLFNNSQFTIMTQSNTAESFKPVWSPELYAKARPDYPRAAIDQILATTKATSNKLNYVDLAAGTGILTKLLIDACTNEEQNKFKLQSVTAIEPSETMLEQLRSTLFDQPSSFVPQLKEQGKLDRDVETYGGTGLFTTIDLTKVGSNLQGNVDLLTIAQAWHWCEDWNGALAQIAKVLKPGGVLAIAWNLEDRETAHWVSAVRDAYEKYEGNSRQYRHGTWKQMYDTEAIKQYEILPEIHLKRALPTTVQGVCDRIISKSYVGVLDAQTQEKILEDIRAIFANNSDETLQRKWIEKDAGIFEYPYATDVLLFRKK